MDRNIIVVTGPESSGKSSLCQALSEQLNLHWVPEYARNYLEKKGPQYDWEDLVKMYAGHLSAQEKALYEHPYTPIIFDTDSINYAVWSQRVFGEILELLSRAMQKEKKHIYLVCYPDLAWEKDPFRENPDDRLEIMEEHLEWIEKLERPFAIVKGQKEERLKNALDALQSLGVISSGL